MTENEITGRPVRPAGRVWFAPQAGDARVPWFLVSYLAAITIIGKGPTYLGLPPLYWGEFVLALGLLKIAPWGFRSDYFYRTRYLLFVLLPFMMLGAVLTALSVGRWRLDALRDAAIWYYGAFVFIGIGLASREAVADRVWRVLRVCWIISLVWNTADLLSRQRLSHSGPVIPWRGVPILFNSTHEAGQNLALGALIVLCTTTLHKRVLWRLVLLPIAVLGLCLFAISEGRGMRVGIASAVVTVLLLGIGRFGRARFNQRLFTLAVAFVPVAALAVAAFPGKITKLSNLDRFAAADPTDPEGTANWRMIWWEHLYDHVMETDPAFGIGFGESLHLYNPLLESLEEEFVVRSPHNFNVTVFSRMGFVGLFLWLGILIIGLGGLCARVWRGRTARGQIYTEERRDELAFWVAMLVCTVVNSSFGVLMEGPVLGIWFWFALGFASGRALSSGRSPEAARGYLARLILRYKLAAYLSPAHSY
ncbi:MAG TPA: O-antigen ligase family protein [Bryobacteraceae bacterium]|nr:O-antigen ligase family protein [Bryobacteraceae bacterium]